MATIAFLLAPQRDIPATFDEEWHGRIATWIDLASNAWAQRWETLADDEKRRVRRYPPSSSLSSNFADAMTFRNDTVVRESAAAWAANAWDAWSAQGRAPPQPIVDPAVAHAALAIDSRMSLADLTSYSSGFAAIPAGKLRRGGRYAFIKSDGNPNAFGFCGDGDTQTALFLEVARAHGGDHLAVWTFGRALNVFVARSERPGARPTLHGPFSVRTRMPDGCARPGGFVEALRGALAGSAFVADLAAIERQLAQPELSVASVFAALGVPGARDFGSADISARWDDLDRIGRAALGGQAVDRKRAKAIQALLEPLGDRRVPTKGKLGKGILARQIAEVAYDVKEALGLPESGIWRERHRAAKCYWDICDGAALERLTTGSDRAGFGTSASIARLLAHFPAPLARDPLFLSLLALECEAANGHAFVDGLFRLAEQTASAGLVLLVADASRREALRSAFGIEPFGDDEAGAGSPCCGEAFIAGTSLTRSDVADAARAWLTKTKSSGAVAVLSPDGAVSATWFRDGAAAPAAAAVGMAPVDEAALRDAALGLLARDAFVAFGAGDLLAPGEWLEGSYSGQAVGNDADHHLVKKKRLANTLLARPVETQPLETARALLAVLGANVRYRGPLSETEGGFVSLRIDAAGDDERWLRDLRNDLLGARLIERYGAAWVEGRQVRGYTCSDLDVALFVQTLGDAPPGTTIAIGRGTDELRAWRIG